MEVRRCVCTREGMPERPRHNSLVLGSALTSQYGQYFDEASYSQVTYRHGLFLFRLQRGKGGWGAQFQVFPRSKWVELLRQPSEHGTLGSPLSRSNDYLISSSDYNLESSAAVKPLAPIHVPLNPFCTKSLRDDEQRFVEFHFGYGACSLCHIFSASFTVTDASS